MKVKIFSKAAIGLFLLVTLCSFTLRFATAQKSQKGDIPEGYTLVDGDMLMPTSFVESLQNAQRLKPNAPQATYKTNLWPNGIVPFEFDTNVTASNQTAMLNAMAVLENVANVDFQQCPGNDCSGRNNYVHAQNSTGNNSNVGMTGGKQTINIFNWGVQFIMVHELLHCLGFFHEHIRPDRNNFVQINCSNVQGGCSGSTLSINFVTPSDATRYGYYDFDSVMHYDQCAFSIDCPAGSTCACTNTTITVLPPNAAQWQNAIGQRDHLSSLDQATVSFLYPFADWCFVDCTYNGSNGSSNGTFLRPYTSFATAVANTPAGGTLWILNTCYFPAGGTYSKQITIKVAPGVRATLGG